MRRGFAAFALFLMLAVSGCSERASPAPVSEDAVRSEPSLVDRTLPEASETEGAADANVLDLSFAAQQVAYAQLYQIAMSPEKYLGKTIRLKGSCYITEDPYTGRTYRSCIVRDVTGCCAQGLDFTIDPENDWTQTPELYDTITIEGVYGKDELDGAPWFRLEHTILIDLERE